MLTWKHSSPEVVLVGSKVIPTPTHDFHEEDTTRQPPVSHSKLAQDLVLQHAACACSADVLQIFYGAVCRKNWPQRVLWHYVGCGLGKRAREFKFVLYKYFQC